MPFAATALQHLYLAISALAAGAQNSLAGGGTLYTFPTLIAVLGSKVMANGTSTVALMPGSMAGAWGFRNELRATRRWLVWLVPPSLLGGGIGTWLVSAMPEKYFDAMVPWLILLAASLFIVQPYIAKWAGVGKPHDEPSLAVKIGVAAFQLLVAVYGGYFGAGIGILMISSLSLMGLGDIHRVNALKTLLAACINGVSVVVWIAQNKIAWPLVPTMAVAAIIGGFLGARLSRRLNKTLVRWLVIIVGLGLATYYFYDQWT